MRIHSAARTLAAVALAGLIAAAPSPADSLPAPDEALERLARAEVTHDRVELQLLIDRWQQRVEAEPEVAAHHYHLARAYFPLIDVFDVAGDPERADSYGEKGLEHAREAVRLAGESNPDTYRLLGDYYGRLTGYKSIFTRMRYGGRSQEHHGKALELTPESPLALIGVGSDKLYAPSAFGGDVEGAAELFARAAELAPEAARPRVWLARAYLALERPADARRTLEEAVRLEPDSALAREELGRLERGEG